MRDKIPENFYLNQKNFVKLRIFFFRRYLSYKNILIKPLLKKKNNLILDIACGEGINNLNFIKNNKVYGFDVSKKALNIAKKKGYKISHQNINNFSFDKQRFDIIFSFGVHGIARSPSSYYRKLYKYLKKDGKLFILNAHLGGLRFLTNKISKITNINQQINYFHNFKRIKTLLKKNNLRILEYQFYSYIKYFNKIKNQKIRSFLSENVTIIAKRK